MELDLNWAALAQAKGPFVLKNVYLQNTDSFIPLSQKAVIPLTMKTNVDHVVSTLLSKGVPTITEEMRQGVRPQMNFSSSSAAACNLVLIHGYCAGVNPWQQYGSADFTNACYFLDKSSNLVNDAYAMKVAEYTKNIPSWGGVSILF